MSHEKAIGGPALACKDRRLELGYDVRAMGGTIRDLIHDFLAIAGVSMKIIIYDCQPQAPTWLLTASIPKQGSLTLPRLTSAYGRSGSAE